MRDLDDRNQSYLGDWYLIVCVRGRLGLGGGTHSEEWYWTDGQNKIQDTRFKSLLSYAQQLHSAVAGNEMLGSQALF